LGGLGRGAAPAAPPPPGVLAEGTDVTPDLRAPGDARPAVGTMRMAEAVAERLRGPR
jgi:hypothetical protein